MSKEIPDDQVRIKQSICGVCNGWVRSAVAHMLSTRESTDFAKEAMKYNLSIREIPLKEYREQKVSMCACPK